MSLEILFNELAINFKAPWDSTSASWDAIDSNLFLAEIKFIPVNFDMYFADKISYPSGEFMPVPTAVAPKASSDKWFNELFKDSNRVLFENDIQKILDLR